METALLASTAAGRGLMHGKMATLNTGPTSLAAASSSSNGTGTMEVKRVSLLVWPLVFDLMEQGHVEGEAKARMASKR